MHNEYTYMSEKLSNQWLIVKRVIVRCVPHAFFFFLFSLLLFAFQVYAADPLVPTCDPILGQPNSCGVKGIFTMMVNVYNYLLGLAALVALLFLIIGGIQLFGFREFTETGSTDKIVQGKRTITQAIFGFVMIAMAYVIVNTVMVWLGVRDPQDFFLGNFIS